jgi:NitT/TauT family transport system ATP-binding protein/sulfonate transport system ATP-binding protein
MIRIRDVSKAYVVGEQVLQVLYRVNITIWPGEFLSVVGTSGSGKSTLLRLLVGLDVDYEGEILIGESRVQGTSLDRGIVFQDHRLFPWLTVEQNVALGLENHVSWSGEEKARAVREHLQLVGLEGFARAHPHQLSGGMAQRAAIARALVNRPGLLLLDEPFGALDALTRQRLQQELQRIWQEERITMVLVTHDVEEAVFLGDRVVVMEPRPGRFKRVVDVDVPHPRSRADPALKTITDEVRGHILEAAAN